MTVLLCKHQCNLAYEIHKTFLSRVIKWRLGFELSILIIEKLVTFEPCAVLSKVGVFQMLVCFVKVSVSCCVSGCMVFYAMPSRAFLHLC